jgi:hypothetical protein
MMRSNKHSKPRKTSTKYFKFYIRTFMPLYAFVVPKKKIVMYAPRSARPLANFMEYAHKFVPIPNVSISMSKMLYDRF